MSPEALLNRAPQKLETLFGRPLEAVKAPSLGVRILRQEVMQSTVLVRTQPPELVEPENSKDQGRFIEKPINPDMPWSSFGQVMFIKEHIREDGKVIKKVAAVSMAYPGGVGIRMAGEALGNTIGIDPSEFTYWGGIKEGGIIAAGKEVSNVMEQFDLMNAFIENSGFVIADRHSQVEHEVVQHFFGLQSARNGFLEAVKEDARQILENPKFTGRSAFDERYQGKGIYLIEGIIEDGVWDGGDPYGKRMRLVNMAADEPHLKWLQWAEKTAAAMKGDGIIVDAEDTETVHDCGGNDKGCSEFFEKMEGGSTSISNGINKYAIINGIAGSIAASEYSESYASGGSAPAAGYDSENCSTCGKDKYDKEECKCSPDNLKSA